MVRMLRQVIALIAVLGPAGPIAAGEALTLESALQEAHAANARLPIPSMDVDIARERTREARAERWLKVSVEGDVIYAPSYGYDASVSNLGEARAQLIGQQPLFDGGGRRATVKKAEADLAAAGARFRIAEKDLDLEVRSRLAELSSAEMEVEVRREGLERLRSYLTSLESRQASGQGLGADVLKTRVRLASEDADLSEATDRLEEARLELNDLLGRDPAAALSIAALPEPVRPPPGEAEAWVNAPEVAEARSEADSAQAALKVTHAERSLHVSAGADAGLWGSDTQSAGLFDRLKHDFGYSLTLDFSWPLFDLGGHKARVAQGALALRQAQQTQEVAMRNARLQWHEARRSRANAFREIEIFSKSLPEAKDSSLATESRYRGGVATAFEVLEAHAAAVDTAVRLASTIMRYRVAEALEIRWGSR